MGLFPVVQGAQSSWDMSTSGERFENDHERPWEKVLRSQKWGNLEFAGSSWNNTLRLFKLLWGYRAQITLNALPQWNMFHNINMLNTRIPAMNWATHLRSPMSQLGKHGHGGKGWTAHCPQEQSCPRALLPSVSCAAVHISPEVDLDNNGKRIRICCLSCRVEMGLRVCTQ